ncbi:MAG: hypothetical protein LBV07_01725 [Syntrophobacterales bacterium]|jgi:hypothetical protein|nr:hypothetical protein [Syntrophobacterales bacterium]
MKKKILALYYSQTGQMREILDALFLPLADMPDIAVTCREIKPQQTFPFPWTRNSFLDVFPESVLEMPVELCPPDINEEKPDLLVLAFQPWYLSPSLPVTSFLQTPLAAKLFADTKVVTVIGARNMWVQSLACVKARIESLGGTLAGNIVLTDRAPNLISVVTIAYWMFSGKKDRLWGIFPLPGVAPDDIEGSSRWGKLLGETLTQNRLDDLGKNLTDLGAAEISGPLARMEKRGKKIFLLWAKAMIKHPSKRKLLLNLFFVELIVGIVILSPLYSLANMAAGFFKRKQKQVSS